MQVRLEIAHRKANVKRVVLRSDTVIGRSSTCNLRIASNQVSRRHCQISVAENGVLIRDLGSSNGTFVRGEQVPPNQDILLSSGEEVSVGPIKFVVRFDFPGESYPPPDSTVELPVTKGSPQNENLQETSDQIVQPQEAILEPQEQESTKRTATGSAHPQRTPPSDSAEEVVGGEEDGPGAKLAGSNGAIGHSQGSEPEDSVQTQAADQTGNLRSLLNIWRKKEANFPEQEQADSPRSNPAESTDAEALSQEDASRENEAPSASSSAQEEGGSEGEDDDQSLQDFLKQLGD